MRFNGAALVRVRKCAQSSRSVRQPLGFNGAALVRVRKLAGFFWFGGAPEAASMGPHSFECGNASSATSGATTRSRFNGAALVRVRKCETEPDAHGEPDAASMGPHSFECGNQ